MQTAMNNRITTEQLVKELQTCNAYPHAFDGEVEFRETHISYVFLAGEFAYKIKKPIQTDFLDYSTLEKRKHFCEEELRLDRRYAPELYLDVVPICVIDGQVRVEVGGEPVDYAVKMRRFPVDALLSDRIDAGKLTTDEVMQLAVAVANFHANANICERKLALGWPKFIHANALEIIDGLAKEASGETAATLKVLRHWCDEYFAEHRDLLTKRIDDGFIRECHGDLHLQNVVLWNDRLMPFDGIEFNDRLRWIDVLSDSAFLAMDLAARGHLDLSRSFINAYLEQTGDYLSLALVRWFLCYRAIVRAMVASMKAKHSSSTDHERSAALDDFRQHIDLAYRFTLPQEPGLWITHGVSGSGKTTVSETVVQRREAMRLRSDLERKRHFGLKPTERPSDERTAKMYSDASNREVYERLRQLARKILSAGYSVIVDATFLKQNERALFRQLAEQQGASFAILDCHTDVQTLRQRVADRMARNSDASDADLQVLNQQLATHEPLTEDEQEFVVDIPDFVQTISRL